MQEDLDPKTIAKITAWFAGVMLAVASAFALLITGTAVWAIVKVVEHFT